MRNDSPTTTTMTMFLTPSKDRVVFISCIMVFIILYNYTFYDIIIITYKTSAIHFMNPALGNDESFLLYVKRKYIHRYKSMFEIFKKNNIQF